MNGSSDLKKQAKKSFDESLIKYDGDPSFYSEIWEKSNPSFKKIETVNCNRVPSGFLLIFFYFI